MVVKVRNTSVCEGLSLALTGCFIYLKHFQHGDMISVLIFANKTMGLNWCSQLLRPVWTIASKIHCPVSGSGLLSDHICSQLIHCRVGQLSISVSLPLLFFLWLQEAIQICKQSLMNANYFCMGNSKLDYIKFTHKNVP